MTVFIKERLQRPLVRPVLLKLGGSVVTDKAGEARFRRPATKRLLGELRKAEVPAVLFHGAGSYGHPPAARHRFGQRAARPDGVAEVLAAAGMLHAEVVQAAQAAGLRPLSFPLHHTVTCAGGQLEDLPVLRIQTALEEGYTPVLSGTLVRDDELAWRVVSADELMAELAHDLDPRLGVFCTDVEGVQGPDGLMPRVRPADLDRLAAVPNKGDDVTGAMVGKLQRAFQVAGCCPTWIVDGNVQGRLLDLLRGKPVPGTRIEID